MSTTNATNATDVNHALASDPRPLPPNKPDDNACCGSGCDPCIFDFYYEEMERFRTDLRAWQARHPQAVEPT